MDDDLYDEFGNYIGEADQGDSDSDFSADSSAGKEAAISGDLENHDMDQSDAGSSEAEQAEEDGLVAPSSIVLYEDKQHYASASDVYGPNVETVLYEQDTDTLDKSIIAPIDTRTYALEEAGLPPVRYSRSYQADLMGFTDQIRNIALVGHLNHGKTSLMDVLVKETHEIDEFTGRREDEPLRYTDVHVLEQERGFSMNTKPMSLLLENSKGKSHLFNILDTPGHVDFVDEVAVAGRLADGFVVVVDVVEGCMLNTEKILEYAVSQDIPFVLVLNKLDRLILDLRLPPDEAYYKIEYVLDDINRLIKQLSPLKNRRVSPELGNVIFASASMGWTFTLQSFAKYYSNLNPKLDVDAFSRRLWGNIYYDTTTRKFVRSSVGSNVKRAFVNFILDPIYKLYSHTLSKEQGELKSFLADLGIFLKPAQLKMNAGPSMRLVSKLFFGNTSSFVDVVLKKIPSPVEGAKRLIESNYTGNTDSQLAESALASNKDGPLLIDFVKTYSSPNAKEFYSLGRVLSGTVSVGSSVNVLGTGYTPDDDEDMIKTVLDSLWISQTRYRVPISSVPAGNWVLVSGLDQTMIKNVTVVSTDLAEDAYVMKPTRFFYDAVFKVSVEPVNPSELPKLLSGLRSITKTYSTAITKVEDSGEHVILCSGEVYMDCIMHDLRKLYAHIDIKVSDPVTRFSETCIDMSAMKVVSKSPNKKNSFTFVAEPLEPDVAADIEKGLIDIRKPVRQISKLFQEKYDWDILAARNIWAFGPDDISPNVLVNDVIASDDNKRLINSIRESTKVGFAWSTREGPLCEEPIRGVKFKLIDVSPAAEPIYRGRGQVIPAVRRACYSSFLLASPRLLEPVYQCHVICSSSSIPIVYDLVGKRRGNVLSDSPIPGTPLYSIKGTVPVIDSFGFETDVRIATKGAASLSLVFDNWQIVPGDPLDKTQKTLPLRPALPQGLARDFVLKTRRRKGLSEEISVAQYLDAEIVEQLKMTGLLD